MMAGEPNLRLGVSELRIGDGAGVGAEPCGHVPLAQIQIEPPLSEVISQRCKGLRVGR